MHTDRIIARMADFPAALRALLASVTQDDARWKPTERDWSILEIVNHLADEEVEDFRTRLALTLDDPTQAWPGIDPEGAARERGYNQRELHDSLVRFDGARAVSVGWLRSLDGPDWSRTHAHPKLGAISADDLLASWSAHDALHLRQIAKRMLQLTQRDAPGCSTGYAGAW